MLSFVNIIFLGGIAAAAIPIVLHLVRNVKARQIPFGTLMFLSATEDQIVKRRKLQDAALMAIRAAVVCLLALVFARPFLPDTTIPFLSGLDRSSSVILLDNSYSMSSPGLFEAAREEAARLIDESDPGDEFSVVVFSDRPQQLTNFDSERTVHGSAIASQDVSYRTTDFYEPLRLAEEILQDARFESRRVFLVSDFQRAGWSGALENWNLQSGIDFVTVPVGDSERRNHFVDDVRISQQRMRAAGAQSAALRFDIIPVRSNDESQALLSLEIEGGEVVEQELPSLDRSRVTLQTSVPSTGTYQGVIRLSSDDLEVDNTHYVTVDVQDKPSILVLGGRGRSRYDDAFFLEKVFDLGDDGLYRLESNARTAVTPSTLRGHTLVILANISPLSQREVDVVAEWVNDGGIVLMSQGTNLDVSRYSSVLERLGVGTATELVNATAEFGDESIVGEVDERHPVFAPLAATGGVILRPEFRRYLRVVPDSSASVMASYDSGDPFLIERKLGSGSVLVHTSTIDNSWNDFPVDELYVPFLYQIAGYAAESSQRNNQFVVGDAVALRSIPGAAWRVRTPSGAEYVVGSTDSGPDETGSTSDFFREANEPGHYLAVSGSSRYPFSVNVDRTESVLTPRDEAEAYAAVASPYVEQDPSISIAGPVQEDDSRQSLWPVLLFIVIALLGLETLIANRRRGVR